MKRALITEAFRSIWKTRSRFLSILAIVAVGTGFFAGIKACTPDMMMTTEEYFKEYNLSDIHLVSTFGFDEKDLAAIEEVDGIVAMMPSYSAELFSDTASSPDTIVKVYSLPLDGDWEDPAFMNRPILKEGRLPQQKGECLVERGKKTPTEFTIGSTIHFRSDEETELSDMLDCDTYTIVGIVESPYYLNTDRGAASIGDGVVDTFVMIPEEHFCYEDDIYTDVHLLVQKPEGLSPFDEDYESLIMDYSERFEALADVRTVARYNEIMDEANAELADAKEELAEGIETQQRELADARQKIADAEQEIADGEREYWDGLQTFQEEIAEAEQELLDAEEELAEAETKLADGEKELQEGWEEYYDGKAQLDEGEAEFQSQKAAAEEGFAQAEAQLAQLKQQLTDAENGAAVLPSLIETLKQQLSQAEQSGMASEAELQMLRDSIKEQEQNLLAAQGAVQQLPPVIAGIETQLNEGRAQLADAQQSLHSAAEQLRQGRKELNEAQKQLEEGRAELEEGKQELADGWEEFYEEKAKAQQELYDAQLKIADGKAELEQAKIDLAEGEAESNAEIADAQQKIADAEAELADVELPEWYIWDREDFGGYASFRDDMIKVDAIAAVFPVFFILVAALVCLTTMSRMVEEERTQIGTMKALGYSEGAIVSKYLIYSISASLIGSILGLAVGFQLFPQIVIGVYRTMYTIPDPMTPFRWDYALWCTLAAIACTAWAALASCRKELRSCPAQLMRPKTPKAGKRVLLERIGWLWKRLSFTYKVTIRNVFRYKRRAFMTILGVAGCTALMVAGFGIRHAIGAIVTRQYGEIFCYDGIVALDEAETEEKDEAVRHILNHELVDSGILALQDSATVSNGQKELEIYLVVPSQQEGLEDYIVLRNRKSHEALSLQEDQVIINEKLSKVMGWTVGDTIDLSYGELSGSAQISAITENYTLNYVYLLPSAYEAVLGQSVDYNTVLMDMTDPAQESRLSKELLENETILGISYASSGNEKFMDMVNSLDIVVWVLIASAGLLAIIVLYNLANININERVRELATIKVLGFYDKEVSSYVYRENNISTGLGILLGLALGTLLEQFALVVVEADDVMFAPDLPLTVFLYSAILTVVFAQIINVIVHFKLKKINMVESMKSVE
ncbi:MAG: FtsX-like permease family protein [Oscillospiraceae bacterium]|nr:FtsX-like permease family protein [Oscillospiraceae bacterium]